jgi:hypothetical protein
MKMAKSETKKEEKDIVHQPSSVPALQEKEQAPDYLAHGQARGMEAVEQSDITLPRLALCQSNTPQRKRADANYIEGLNEGDFFNTITQTNYGPKVTLVPILFSKQRIKFNKPEEGGGIDCRSFNGKTGGHYSPDSCDACPHSQFRIEDHEQIKPSCLLFHNRVSWILPQNEMAVSSLKSTGLTVSKQWNMLVKLSNKDLFGRVYELESVSMTKAGNSFYGVKLVPKGWTPEEIYKQMEDYFEALRDKNIVMDTTGIEGDEPPDTAFNSNSM